MDKKKPKVTHFVHYVSIHPDLLPVTGFSAD